MPTKSRLSTIRMLLMLIVIGCLGPIFAGDGRIIPGGGRTIVYDDIDAKVHALLILLGDDATIQPSVAKNEITMRKVIAAVSEHCEVQMTVMKSEATLTGTVTELTLFDKNVQTQKSMERQSHGIITPKEVSQWIQNLSPNPEDIILIYYSGHGGMDDFGTHFLSFSSVDTVPVSRDKIRERLVAKPGRLKLLITDTCSNNINVPTDAHVNFAAEIEAKRYNTKDLFFRHGGLVDITAAGPGEWAWGNSAIGGYFTYALSESFAPTSGDFLSWEEVFEATRQKTKERFSEALLGTGTFGVLSSAARRRMKNQKTQTPTAHELPEIRLTSDGLTFAAMSIPTLHALLIHRKVDTDRMAVAESVDKSTATIRKLLQEIASSEIAELKLTSLLIDSTDAKQTLQRLQTLRPHPDDIVFVYYIGAGYADENKELYLGQPNTRWALPRKEIVKSIQGLQCRLKILITDSDSFGPAVTEQWHDKDDNIVSDGTILGRRDVFKHLFLQHEGFLNLTAATEGEHAFGTTSLGSFLSWSLRSTIYELQDTDKDDFASWEEVFWQTRQTTMYLFDSQRFTSQQRRDFERRGIRSQRPKYYGELPKRRY